MRVVTPPNQHPSTCLLARRGHDLAPLDRDAARISKPIWRRTIRANTRISFNNLPRLFRSINPNGRCGTLTHRQDPHAKRKPIDGIAAAQQTYFRDGARCRGSNRNESIDRTLWTGREQPRAAALYHDVLGFGGAIGLIRVVRSASSRG
jgi:hypothetical protein